MTLQLRSLLIPLSLLILHLLLRVILAFRVCWILSWPFRQLMVSFWWMRSRSFWHCKQIWQAFGALLHHLLLMMSLDCPLAIHHKKREYIWMEIGRDFRFLFFVFFFFLELWSFRFYLGASWCIYFFGSWCIYFYGMYMLRGDIMFFIFIFIFLLSILLFLVSHVLHWLLIYIKRLFMIYVFYFLFCEIKILFCFYLYFPHMCLCVCWVLQEYTGWFSHATVYTGNW